jgi:hypothetical protein
MAQEQKIMNLTPRERLFVRVGAMLLPLILIVLFVVRPLLAARDTAGSGGKSVQEEFSEYKRNVLDIERLRKQQKGLEKKLSLTVPAESVDEQLSSFVKKFEETVKKSRAKVSDFVPRRARRRQSGSTRDAQRSYSMHLETDQQNLINLFKALQGFEKPIQITSIDVKNNEKQPGKLKVSLEFHTYLFDGSNK